MRRYTELAISNPDDLVFGQCPQPLTTRRGLVIGGGTVYPELNFTLPAMTVEASTMPKVCEHYRQMVTDALARAVQLEADGVVVEFETLPPMTAEPDWGMQIVEILQEALEDVHAKHGLKTALRMTPNDNREMVRPPRMREGEHWEHMLELFDRSAAAGADLLSIESVGGKEVHDQALLYGDIRQVIFALCVMGVRDMEFLWQHIVEIAERHGVVAAGDTACGFANTAMVLAEQRMIPASFAAVVRAVSAVRSLVAYECGARGPGKDCGYENVYLKAITGLPMSLEGKTAACAHRSPVGNIAMAACDLWSNESVQNVRLLGGQAPTVSMEQLIYDCRLMNVATGHGEARRLRDWLVESDAPRDPQAYILTPANAVQLAGVLVAEPNHYRAGRAVARQAVEILQQGSRDGRVRLDPRDAASLEMMSEAIETMPDDVEAFSAQMMAEVEQERFVAADYQLSCGCAGG